MGNFAWAHEDEVSLRVTIDWSEPKTHAMLHAGLAKENDTAYFYAIIDEQWWPYYIGMVYSQDVSSRHKNKDHLNRIARLKELYPDTVWHLTLGTPTVEGKRILKKTLIENIEGLLIYCNYNDYFINEKKIYPFFAKEYISITSTGFTDPFVKQAAFGAFYAS